MTLSFVANDVDGASDVSTKTWTAKGIGTTGGANRYVVAAFTFRNASASISATSATIAGVSATLVDHYPAIVGVATTYWGLAMYYASMATVNPADTTGNYVINMSGNSDRNGMMAWSSSVPVTLLDKKKAFSNNGGSLVATPIVLQPHDLLRATGGFTVGAISGADSATGTGSVSWSSMTERVDAAVSGSTRYGGADTDNTGNTELDETVTFSAGAGWFAPQVIVASFQLPVSFVSAQREMVGGIGGLSGGMMMRAKSGILLPEKRLIVPGWRLQGNSRLSGMGARV